MANVLGAAYRWAIPAAIGISLAQASIYDVKGGTRAVIFDRLAGVKEQVVNEGTHFLVPWLQRAIVYDVRTKPRNISTTTGSKDLQMVSLTLRVLHRPEVQMLPKIYQVSFFLSKISSRAFKNRNIKLSRCSYIDNRRTSDKTTMNVFSPLSVMRFSRLLSPSLTPPN